MGKDVLCISHKVLPEQEEKEEKEEKVESSEEEQEYGFEIKTPLTKYLLGIPVEEIEKSMKENPHKSALSIAIEKSIKEKPHIAASEPINTSEDWTILFNDSLSKYSIIKCDFPIEESMEFCYSDLNEFD